MMIVKICNNMVRSRVGVNVRASETTKVLLNVTIFLTWSDRSCVSKHSVIFIHTVTVNSQDIGREKILKYGYCICVIVFAGYWNCAADDKFQKDGWASHSAGRTTRDRKSVHLLHFYIAYARYCG